MSVDVTVWGVLIATGVSCFTIPFLPSQLKSSAAFFFVLVIAIATSIPAISALAGSLVEIVFYGGSVFENIYIRIDALSAWFILIVNFTCVNGALYGIGYMKLYADQKRNISLHWILFIVFHVSMLSVCILQNSLAFLIAWELMSISSFLLVIFEHYKSDTLKAGMNYLIQMHIGVVFLSIAFIWVYFSAPIAIGIDFEDIASFFKHHSPAWLFFTILHWLRNKSRVYSAPYVAASCTSCGSFTRFRSDVRGDCEDGDLWYFAYGILLEY